MKDSMESYIDGHGIHDIRHLRKLLKVMAHTLVDEQIIRFNVDDIDTDEGFYWAESGEPLLEEDRQTDA